MIQEFYSNGKLLLSGEYVVLDGALALAIPTKKGQRMIVQKNVQSRLIWNSYDVANKIWLQCDFEIEQIIQTGTSDFDDLTRVLLETLKVAHTKNPSIFKDGQGYTVTCYLDFDRDWGLGSSSTWINNIASWFMIDPFELLYKSFGGSGYDIACAYSDTAILYQKFEYTQKVTAIDFNPFFKQHLYFVHLNQKQSSKEGIATYRAMGKQKLQNQILKINALTIDMVQARDLDSFSLAMFEHEKVIADILEQPTVQSRLFNDFDGVVKSLGAWGGDFVLAAGQGDVEKYFIAKGYSTVISYDKMIK